MLGQQLTLRGRPVTLLGASRTHSRGGMLPRGAVRPQAALAPQTGRRAASVVAPAPPTARAALRRPSVAARYAGVPVEVVVAPLEIAVALPLPRAVESAADDPLLANPLQRLERLSTGWFGVIADYDGVVVDSTLEVHKAAWRQVAAEMGLRAPLGSVMDRIHGARDEVVSLVHLLVSLVMIDPIAWLICMTEQQYQLLSPLTHPTPTPPSPQKNPPDHPAVFRVDAQPLKGRRDRGAQGGGLRRPDGRQQRRRGAGGAGLPGDAAEKQGERRLRKLAVWTFLSSSTADVAFGTGFALHQSVLTEAGPYTSNQHHSPTAIHPTQPPDPRCAGLAAARAAGGAGRRPPRTGPRL
jgi:hypothetical protein